MKTAFVILHYCIPEITINCVTSLLSLNGEKEIVIVDNASPDGSGKILQQKYDMVENVNILLNERNGGFAEGNNIGYRYAKSKLNPDFIIVMNNDTLINDNHFLSKLYADNSLASYHIIAPDIITAKGIHQNPYRRTGLGYEQIKSIYNKKRLGLWFYSLPILYRFRKLNPNITHDDKLCIKISIKGVVPHGAAIIYSKHWIEAENFAFYPGTFMYYEEDLLYYYAISKHYKISYEPYLQIIHMEDMSTNAAYKGTRERLLFQTREKIKSLKIIIDFIKTTRLL